MPDPEKDIHTLIRLISLLLVLCCMLHYRTFLSKKKGKNSMDQKVMYLTVNNAFDLNVLLLIDRSALAQTSV